MYKILNSQGLGAAGRQNELIELALTHSFGGVEVDMVDLVGRHDALGKQFACQFLQSAGIDMGTFCLPIDFGAEDADYAKQMAKLETVIDLAKTLNTKRCYAAIQPASSVFAFQENFEKHRERLDMVGQKFAEHGIQVGLALQASKAANHEGSHKFIQTAEELLTLCKTIGNDNVGIMLNVWEWAIGGGAMDQISECDVKTFTEVRLADLNPEADLAAVKSSDRVLAGELDENSISVQVVKYLVANNYEGSVSIASDASTFAHGSNDKVVGALSKRLDKLVAGEPIHEPVEEEATEEEATEEGAEAAEGDKKTEAKPEADAAVAKT